MNGRVVRGSSRARLAERMAFRVYVHVEHFLEMRRIETLISRFSILDFEKAKKRTRYQEEKKRIRKL